MQVVVTYLEMRDASSLRAATGGPQLELRRLGEPCAALNRFFYVEVGRAWRWVDRLSWTDDAWQAWVERPQLSTWIAGHAGNPVGYAELDHVGDDLEVTYFGLLPQFIGRGMGAVALTQVIEAAWSLGPRRVWLHTCSLDHPGARANYERRGFRAYKEEFFDAPDPVPSG